MTPLRRAGLSTGPVLVGCFCLLVVLGDPAAEEQKESPREYVERLLENSGLDAYAEGLRRLYEPELGQWKRGLSPSRFRILRSALDRATDPARTHEILVGHFLAHARPRALLASQAFFKASLGRRIRKAQRELASPEGTEGLAAFVETMRSIPPSESKQQMASRLDLAIGASAERLGIHLTANRSLFMAARPLLSDDRQKTQEELDELLRAHAEKVAERVRVQIRTTLLYQYQRLTTVELSRYTAFAESRAGRWFYETRRGAIQKVMAAQGSAIAAEVDARVAALR